MSDFPAPPAGFHPTGVQGERGGAPSAFNPNSGDPHPDDPVRLGYHGSHDTDPDVIAQRKAEDPNWTLAEPVTTEVTPEPTTDGTTAEGDPITDAQLAAVIAHTDAPDEVPA